MIYDIVFGIVATHSNSIGAQILLANHAADPDGLLVVEFDGLLVDETSIPDKPEL